MANSTNLKITKATRTTYSTGDFTAYIEDNGVLSLRLTGIGAGVGAIDVGPGHTQKLLEFLDNLRFEIGMAPYIRAAWACDTDDKERNAKTKNS